MDLYSHSTRCNYGHLTFDQIYFKVLINITLCSFLIIIMLSNAVYKLCLPDCSVLTLVLYFIM